MDIKVVSVNISVEKGTIKKPVEFIEISDKGIIGDAHAGNWNRQISLLGVESIEKFSKDSGMEFKPGEFAENITTEGFTLYDARPLDRFVIGEVEMEVTQIGKSCHGDGCAIYREVGKCVMPKEGIFCRTTKKGLIRPGDIVNYYPRIMKIFILTISDRAYYGEYQDRSGPRAAALTEEYFKSQAYGCEISREIIPDDEKQLRHKLIECRDNDYDVVFTTGGTGIGFRDITPEVTLSLLDKEIPGIMEHIRLKFGQVKPGALLSRAVAGLMGKTLVFNMPGSVKAVDEYTGEIFKNLRHLIYMIHSLDIH